MMVGSAGASRSGSGIFAKVSGTRKVDNLSSGATTATAAPTTLFLGTNAADPAFLPIITRARQVMATYADMEELIRLGAYRPGSSPEVDEAIRLHEPLESFLRQAKDEATSLGDGYRQLAQILSGLETER